MKLYYHPVSTTSRPIMLLAADDGIALDYEVVDLFTGAHLQPQYSGINPSQQVPLLEDDGFRLSESSAILKYLAEKTGSPTYPRDIRERARINEVMDWLIYFRDPNGYVIELTAKIPGCESEMDPSKNQARNKLDRWQAGKLV